MICVFIFGGWTGALCQLRLLCSALLCRRGIVARKGIAALLIDLCIYIRRMDGSAMPASSHRKPNLLQKNIFFEFTGTNAFSRIQSHLSCRIGFGQKPSIFPVTRTSRALAYYRCDRGYPRRTPMETPGTDWATSAVMVPAAHLCLVHKN